MSIRLQKMTKYLARTYFSSFVPDPDLFLDKSQYKPYVYSDEKADAVVARYQQLGRVYLAVMLDHTPIGEVILKNIDREQKHCTLGISMQSDAYKNKGYGTQAEKLVLKYAFTELGMEKVLADALVTNRRSQHVLEKAGFVETRRDGSFVYFECDKTAWIGSQQAASGC